MTVSDLHTRAMLVTLNISAWSARKYDKKVTQEVTAAHGASNEAGRFNKCLLPGESTSYQALMKHLAAARIRHYALTLPWNDSGQRCLTMRAYQRYTDQLRADKHITDTLSEEFFRDYPALREAARGPLNGMWNEDDYPVNIRSKFSFDFQFDPIPAGDDFRVQLTADEMAILATQTENRVAQRFNKAQADCTRRLFDVIAKMRSKLAEPDATFHDSLIQNVRDLCSVLSDLNLKEDPKLETIRREVEILATATEPQTLRDNTDVRIDTANRAQAILDAMVGTYGASVFQGGK